MAEQTTLHLHPAHRGPISAAFFQRINLEPFTPLFGEALNVMFDYLNSSDYILQEAKGYKAFDQLEQQEIVAEVIVAVCDFYNERGWENLDKAKEDKEALVGYVIDKII